MVASYLLLLTNLAIVNSYILKTNGKPRKEDQLTFRINLARRLISGFPSRKRRGRPVFMNWEKTTVPQEIRLSAVGTHFPETGFGGGDDTADDVSYAVQKQLKSVQNLYAQHVKYHFESLNVSVNFMGSNKCL